MFLLVGGMVAFGFYQVSKGNAGRREAKAEQRAIRASLIPFLQAEEDVRFLQRQALQHQAERKLMAHDPTFKVGQSPYKTDIWFPPATNKFG
jgi:NADH dehydrogenase (ubiquinone) 1 alpha subcomplex subunit 13